MKTRTAIVLTFIIASFSATSADEVIRISNRSLFVKLSRGTVIFPHERHYSAGIDCLRCHHRYEKGVNVLTYEELLPGSKAVSCASCHSRKRNLERAYHNMCITCHRETEIKRNPSGPVMCGLCHSQKEK